MLGLIPHSPVISLGNVVKPLSPILAHLSNITHISPFQSVKDPIHCQ